MLERLKEAEGHSQLRLHTHAFSLALCLLYGYRDLPTAVGGQYLMLEGSQSLCFASPGFESLLWPSLALPSDESLYFSVPLSPLLQKQMMVTPRQRVAIGPNDPANHVAATE